MPFKSKASKLAFHRNGFLGQLSMTRTNLQNMIKSDLISNLDANALAIAAVQINKVIKRWDKHYVKKNKKRLIK